MIIWYDLKNWDLLDIICAVVCFAINYSKKLEFFRISDAV